LRDFESNIGKSRMEIVAGVARFAAEVQAFPCGKEPAEEIGRTEDRENATQGPA
jgi:hypothetical protein